MISFSILIFLFSLIASNDGNPLSRSYIYKRMKIIEDENKMAFGSSIGLSPAEELANQCLMKAKFDEVDHGYLHPTEFLPAQNYLEVSKKIKKSVVYQMIRKMPKGALFHAHISSMLPPDELIKFTYEPNLYICKTKNLVYKFVFSKNPPGKKCDWKLLSDVRKRDPKIDAKIKKSLVLQRSKYEDLNVVWNDFEEIFDTVKGIITYRPVFEKYLRGVLEEVYKDNIMFIEVRSGASQLYELDGRHLDTVKSAKVAFNIVKKFNGEHPDFLGMKIIYSPHRDPSPERLKEIVQTYKQLKEAFPDKIIGFDFIHNFSFTLVRPIGMDILQTLTWSTQFFLTPSVLDMGESTFLPETNLQYLTVLRFNSFALPKHPKVMEIVKNKGIAIEINPISNQVLKLVDDLRNHPASEFFANNLPVVVSSDDPSYWDAKSLSSDFYETFVGIMSRSADLRSLKQLALNSITYSGLNDQEKHAAEKIFKTKWQEYMDKLTQSKYCTEINETS
uniref:adenosine deaminase n=1 Tax=Trichogramma kaykai TaxID=54128 RepID=A0ABD2WI84_9HYME